MLRVTWIVRRSVHCGFDLLRSGCCVIISDVALMMVLWMLGPLIIILL